MLLRRSLGGPAKMLRDFAPRRRITILFRVGLDELEHTFLYFRHIFHKAGIYTEWTDVQLYDLTCP